MHSKYVAEYYHHTQDQLGHFGQLAKTLMLPVRNVYNYQ